MHLNYFGLVFIFFGSVILLFRNYFLKASIKDRSQNGIESQVALQMELNKAFKKDVPQAKIEDQFTKINLYMIITVGAGFFILGILVLVGIWKM